MSKPEPPRNIDPLPTSKAAESRKTGWEPPSPQKVRSSERKMGVVLAFSLLCAIGFVAYRKFDEQRHKPEPEPNQFLADNESPPDESPTADLGDDVQTDPPPTFSLGSRDAEPQDSFPPPAEGSAAPAALLFADSDLPHQSEPGGSAFEIQSSEPVEFSPPPEQSDPFAEDPADDSSDPFQQSNSDALANNAPDGQAEIVTESDNPFGAATFAESDAATFAESEPVASIPDEEATFSSDAESPFGGPVEFGTAEFEDEPMTGDPALAAADRSSDEEPLTETPVLDLFGGDEPLPEQHDEPGAAPSLAASPLGDPVDTSTVADSEPPDRLEPNDPQSMPPLMINPFATAEAEPEPPPADPTDNQAFSPFPEATATTEVREASSFDAPSGNANPFATGGSTTVTQHEPAAHHDPFAPARDVRQAVNEEEVVIHVVQNGDNFWKIAHAHYGTGTYFTALAAYNQSRIPDPRRMRPGMKVLVPSQATLARQFPQLVSGGAASSYVAPPTAPAGFSLDAAGRPQYRVAKGDTLSMIAERHLGRGSRWRQIYGMNRDQLPDADSLTTGMVLRLPADAAQVRMDAGNVRGR